MPKPIIPLRPDNLKTQLSQSEQTCLTFYVLFGCTREEAFFKFARPDMAESQAKAVVKETIKQFYSRADVKDYITAYQETLKELFNPKRNDDSPKKTISLEERKTIAKTKAMEFAMDLANHIEDAEDPEVVLKLMDKVGLLDGDEQVEEQPRRYIPQSCLDGCRYRIFVEENCEDECQFCRYKKYGEENGVHFKNEEMLDIPQKVAE